MMYSALTRDRVANFLRSSLLISYWLLGFVFASLLEVWIKLLKHWGRSSGLSLKSFIELSVVKKISLKWRQIECIQTRNKQNFQLIKWKKIHFALIEWGELLHFSSDRFYPLTLKPTNNNEDFNRQGQVNIIIHICEHSTPLSKDGAG